MTDMRMALTAAFSLMLAVVCKGQDFALSTNMLDYANFGTINLQASYGVARHWSVNAAVKYNPFTYNEGADAVQNKQLSYAAGARYWPWHIYSGWWVAGAVRYQEYNAGGLLSRETSEGDRFGGGLSAGYTHMLGPHFNLDFGLGFWTGYDVYTTYACQSCGRIVEDGGKYFIKPADITLALTYIF